MKGIAVTAVTTALLIPAADADASALRQRYRHLYYEVVRKLGDRAPGRQIASRGVRLPSGGVRPATTRDIVRSIHQLRRLLAPPPRMLVRTATPPPAPPSGVQHASVQAGSTLTAIAACESGGNPSAISPSGQYRGKYQFDYGTWASVGGSGDPAAASESEQDQRAAALYRQRGASPWPVCGR